MALQEETGTTEKRTCSIVEKGSLKEAWLN